MKKSVYELVAGDVIEYSGKRFVFERSKKVNVVAQMEGTEKMYNLRIPYDNEFEVVGKAKAPVNKVAELPKFKEVKLSSLKNDELFCMARNSITELFRAGEMKNTRRTIISPMTNKQYVMRGTDTVVRIGSL